MDLNGWDNRRIAGKMCLAHGQSGGIKWENVQGQIVGDQSFIYIEGTWEGGRG